MCVFKVFAVRWLISFVPVFVVYWVLFLTISLELVEYFENQIKNTFSLEPTNKTKWFHRSSMFDGCSDICLHIYMYRCCNKPTSPDTPNKFKIKVRATERHLKLDICLSRCELSSNAIWMLSPTSNCSQRRP